jgi:hypothetical protein
MIRLVIGLRILRGPRGSTPVRALREASSGDTLQNLYALASPDSLGPAHASIAQHRQRPSGPSLTRPNLSTLRNVDLRF